MNVPNKKAAVESEQATCMTSAGSVNTADVISTDTSAFLIHPQQNKSSFEKKKKKDAHNNKKKKEKKKKQQQTKRLTIHI